MVYNMPEHAARRMKNRKIAIEEVIEAIEDPKRAGRLHKRNKKDGKRLHILGKNGLTVIIALPNHVVTVYRYNRDYKTAKKKEKANKSTRENTRHFRPSKRRRAKPFKRSNK